MTPAPQKAGRWTLVVENKEALIDDGRNGLIATGIGLALGLVWTIRPVRHLLQGLWAVVTERGPAMAMGLAAGMGVFAVLVLIGVGIGIGVGLVTRGRS